MPIIEITASPSSKDVLRITGDIDRDEFEALLEFEKLLDSKEVKKAMETASGSKGKMKNYCVRCKDSQGNEVSARTIRCWSLAQAIARAALMCGGPFSVSKGAC